MKKLLIIFAACIAVLAGTAQAAGLDSAKEKLTAFGIIDKSYDTGAELTRAEFADIIARFFPEDTLDYSKDNKFHDVTAQHELAGSVNKAAHYGIMGGVGNGMFAPDEAVTREQIGIAMVRLLGYNLKAERRLQRRLCTDGGIAQAHRWCEGRYDHGRSGCDYGGQCAFGVHHRG